MTASSLGLRCSRFREELVDGGPKARPGRVPAQPLHVLDVALRDLPQRPAPVAAEVELHASRVVLIGPTCSAVGRGIGRGWWRRGEPRPVEAQPRLRVAHLRVGPRQVLYPPVPDRILPALLSLS